MKHLSLASRYRPQTFAEVIGQHLATAALSRAASEGRIAPAYLLSGTRGVGKTTIARIFAKALNCENPRQGEPCNKCRQCVQITAGNHVDVNEIDGASNTGVDDVRALRENIGFMPMEGKYKIFIVDEAHMLSKNAFNALLKTLEEPPAHTVFIFATTEAHRFPATIISRCQHFVFRHLSEETIFKHLCDILSRENVEYEEGAARLLARRANGSVRDSLSLLDQTLSLCQGKLDMETARDSLGLAGQDFYNELFEALVSQDCVRIIELCRQLLHSGVDIGFFIRELSANLRNLFLVAQMGEKIVPSLTNAPDESAFLLRQAQIFSVQHLHAAWQMTLESQRSIIQNPEPGSALELLLINLAMLPKLLPVGDPRQPRQAAQANRGETVASSENIGVKENEAPSSAVQKGMEEEPSAAYAVNDQNIEKRSTSGNRTPGRFSWQGFCDFCNQEKERGNNIFPSDLLMSLNCEWKEGELEISACKMLIKRMEKNVAQLAQALQLYCGDEAPVINMRETAPPRSEREMIDACSELPEVRLCQNILKGTITSCQEK